MTKTNSMNYAKILRLFQQTKKLDGRQYLLQDEIKEEVLKMIRHYTFEMLGNPNDNDFYFYNGLGIFDIDQIKIDLPEFLNEPIEKLKSKLHHVNCYDFIIDLNDLTHYNAFKEYDDDFEPFYKYVCVIAEFWLDELESVQGQYLIDREKDAAKFIAVSYLKSIYSPYTVLGRKRFDKEREALFN